MQQCHTPKRRKARKGQPPPTPSAPTYLPITKMLSILGLIFGVLKHTSSETKNKRCQKEHTLTCGFSSLPGRRRSDIFLYSALTHCRDKGFKLLSGGYVPRRP